MHRKRSATNAAPCKTIPKVLLPWGQAFLQALTGQLLPASPLAMVAQGVWVKQCLLQECLLRQYPASKM